MEKKEKMSYAMGMNVASQLLQMPIEWDGDVLAQAIKDLLSDNAPKLSDAEYSEGMREIQLFMQQENHRKADAASQKNIEEGKKFLAENGARKDVITTASGLQYEVLTEGSGKHPGPKDTVRVHYEGRLIDGTVFDSSIRRGQPIEFPLNGVIAGWTEGVQLMGEGAKFRFAIPSDLAYGPRGAGEAIGPNATLIFDVELIKVL